MNIENVLHSKQNNFGHSTDSGGHLYNTLDMTKLRNCREINEVGNAIRYHHIIPNIESVTVTDTRAHYPEPDTGGG